MRRIFIVTALAFSALALAFAQTGAPVFTTDIPPGLPKPWTAVPPASSGGNFTFTIFGDRTGMAYPGRMEKAFAMVNSQFIISVGDNVEGYTRDPQAIDRMWSDFDSIVTASKKVFFRLPGNHDLSNDVMKQAYIKRYGREYYSFVYQNVLFLAIDTEDPPSNMTVEWETRTGQYLKQIQDVSKDDPAKAQRMVIERTDQCDPEALHLSQGADLASTNISETQVNYVQKVLRENPNVKWTFVLMHRPGWRTPPSANFARIQKFLADRNYTVIAGHFHQYKKEMIDGHEYYTMGPTAALARCDHSQDDFDQVLDVRFDGTKPSVERRWVQ
jgi:hypothetical protein